jgi:hypothetical protein
MEFQKYEGKIQKTWAKRLSLLAQQYPILITSCKTPPDEQFDATLYLSILNSLLSYAKDLYKQNLNDVQFSEDLVELATVNSIHPSGVTQKRIIEAIRNAISHPLGATDLMRPIKVTGFNSKEKICLSTGINQVTGFVFTHAACIKPNGERDDNKCNKSSICNFDKNAKNSIVCHLEIEISIENIQKIIASISKKLSE